MNILAVDFFGGGNKKVGLTQESTASRLGRFSPLSHRSRGYAFKSIFHFVTEQCDIIFPYVDLSMERW